MGGLYPAGPSIETGRGAPSSLSRSPDSSSVSAVMPFNVLKAMSDTDADALYLYLKSLSPRNTSER